MLHTVFGSVFFFIVFDMTLQVRFPATTVSASYDGRSMSHYRARVRSSDSMG